MLISHSNPNPHWKMYVDRKVLYFLSEDMDENPDLGEMGDEVPMAEGDAGYPCGSEAVPMEADDHEAEVDGGVAATTNNPGDTSSGLDSSEKDNLVQFINSKMNKNTVRKTNNIFTKFVEWLRKEKNETCHPIEMSSTQLDCYVGSFILSIRKDDGAEYEPDSLTSYHRAINRKLEELGSSFNLVKDPAFRTSRKVLEAKRRDLKQQGLGNRPNKSDPLNKEQEDKLWETGELGMSNPTSLQNTMWYLNTKLLGHRGCHESRQMK